MTVQRRQRYNRNSEKRSPFEKNVNLKKRMFCPEIMRSKLIFDTKQEADSFIEYSDVNNFHKNKVPTRSYYCEACKGWHVSSRNDDRRWNFASIKTVMDMFAPDTWEYDHFDKDAELVYLRKDGNDFILFPQEVMEQVANANDDIIYYEICKNENKKYVIYTRSDQMLSLGGDGLSTEKTNE